VANSYLHHAGAKVRQYEADALMNGLAYDRGEEVGAVHSFGDSLHEAIAVRGAASEALPNWNTVQREAPAVYNQLLECGFEMERPVRVAMPNWWKPAPKPAYSTRLP
jgi:hypothetical protein